MTDATLTDRLKTALWSDNPGLVQLLGLCPLLAVTTSFVNGLGLGIATLLVLTCSNLLVSATRRFIRSEVRIPMYVLIIASLVTCIELIVYAWFPGLGRSLVIDRPMIVTNCAIFASAEMLASRNPDGASVDAARCRGCGVALLLCALGVCRELVGHGRLFSQFHLLFGGEPGGGLVLHDGGFLLAILPPGAFISLALAVAAKNALDRRRLLARNTDTRRSLSRSR
jgi:electron transport complex protein RnfE